ARQEWWCSHQPWCEPPGLLVGLLVGAAFAPLCFDVASPRTQRVVAGVAACDGLPFPVQLPAARNPELVAAVDRNDLAVARRVVPLKSFGAVRQHVVIDDRRCRQPVLVDSAPAR